MVIGGFNDGNEKDVQCSVVGRVDRGDGRVR